MSKKRKSIVIKGPYPDMWIPEMLRTPVRIRVFWYQKVWNFFKVIGRAIAKPFKKKPALEVKAEVGAE